MRNISLAVGTSFVALAAFAASPAFAQSSEPATTPAPQAQAAAAGPAAAEAEEEEILVTAQRREERSRDVPITITNLSNEQLEDANVEELGDIVKVTPALHYENTGAFSQPSIRGVTTALVTSGGGANVGIYVDGFYSPNPLAADAQLMNVRSIQVLKGPQGTLFGRNTTGGAILITTAKPSTEPSAIVEASYGSFNAMKAQAYVTAGLTEDIAVDAEALYRRGDGYFDDIFGGVEDIGEYESWSVRLGLFAQLTDDVSVLLRYQHQDIDDPSAVLFNTWERNGIPLSSGRIDPTAEFATRPGDIATDGEPFFRMKQDVVQATITADLGFATLTSYTQYRKENSEQVIDLDGSTSPIFNILIPVDDQTFSQELLLTSNPGPRLQWTAGLFYFDYEDHFRDQSSSSGGSAFIKFADSHTRTRSIAGFLDATYQVSDQFFITAGARYSHDEVREANFLNFDLVTFTNLPVLKKNTLTPRLVLRYKPSQWSSVYASVTRGYKAPIYNVGGRAFDPVRPETLTAFEVGYKYGRGPLSADVSAYYYKYKDLQVASYDPTASIVNNAGQSRIYGIEGQLRYAFGNGFEINAGAAYTNAKYTDFPDAPDILDVGGFLANVLFVNPDTGEFNAEGNAMQRAPKFTANLGARYETQLGGGQFALSGNIHYASKSYFDPANQFAQEGHENLTLRAEWTDPSDRFTVAVFGDNITNKRYRMAINSTGLGIISLWNSPRTFGASVRAKL